MESAIVIGAGSAIGRAFAAQLADRGYHVHAVSRLAAEFPQENIQTVRCDYSESGMAAAGASLQEAGCEPSLVGIFLGVLHGEDFSPEKRLEDLRSDALQHVLSINTVLPALWLKHLLPLLSQGQDCRVAILSARVGSISDNRLGGWYAYRASKAALNMMLQCAAVEFARRANRVKLIAFHPGTTDTPLSQPFQANVPADKLFSPEYVAQCLADVMESSEPDGTLDYVDYAGRHIDW